MNDVHDVEQFTHWLANAVLARAAEESTHEGGKVKLPFMVVVETGTPDPLLVRVTCHAGEFRLSVTERKGMQDGRQENEG